MIYHKTYEHTPEAEWVAFIHVAGGSSSIWYRQIRTYQKDFNLLLVKNARVIYKKEIQGWYNLLNGLNPFLKYFGEKKAPIPTL